MNFPKNRILHVPRRFSQNEWGGTEAVITNLCEAQLSQGLFPEIHTSLALSDKREESFRNIPIHRYPYCYPFFGLSKQDKQQLDKKGGNLLSWSLYRAMRKAKQVRIFHAHVTKRTGASVLKAAKLAKRPCVVTLHGNMFDVPQFETDDVVAPQAGKWEWGRAFGAYFGSRSMLQNVDAVLCVGFSEYEKAIEKLGENRVHFLPNGVHPERFHATKEERETARRKLGFKSSDFLFGCISRLDPQKDQLLLIEAFSSLAATDLKIGLILCGPVTNSNYLAELEAAVRHSGHQDRIRILPPVVPDTIEHRSLFAALDCFTLPSRHEPFGIVVLEAWSAGKPVIASNVGGLARLIRNGETGLHIESGNSDSLKAAMHQMFTNKKLRQETVKIAQAEIKKSYTWPKIAQQLEEIYQKVEENYK